MSPRRRRSALGGRCCRGATGFFLFSLPFEFRLCLRFSGVVGRHQCALPRQVLQSAQQEGDVVVPPPRVLAFVLLLPFRGVPYRLAQSVDLLARIVRELAELLHIWRWCG